MHIEDVLISLGNKNKVLKVTGTLHERNRNWNYKTRINSDKKINQ